MIARWQQRYQASDCRHKEPDPLIVLAARQLPAGHAIDLACGAGRHALYLAQNGWSVTAIDGASAALDLFNAPHITKFCQDLEQTIPNLQAGLIVDTLYLDRKLFPLMKQQAQAVALVLPTHNDDPQVRPMNPAFLVGDNELAEAFAGWRIIRNAIRQQPGKQRLVEFLATRTR